MNIKKSLKLFGLENKEQETYLLLLKIGWCTTLELSRKSPIKRTTLYRILESLSRKGLVEVKVDDKTTYYTAADPIQFETIVLEQEKKAQQLRRALKDIQPSLKLISSLGSQETSVLFYRGTRGLKQLEWKKLRKPNSFIYIFDAGDLWLRNLGREFAEKIREETVKMNIRVFEIDNKETVEPIPKDGHPTWTDNLEYIRNHFQNRVIPSELMKITQDIYIIEDAVHIHGYRENDIMGIEIQSPDFSLMLQQLFKNLWNQAKAFDNFGGKNF